MPCNTGAVGIHIAALATRAAVAASTLLAVLACDFIMRHYRAYGGPRPPPIEHQGIDDAFLEKASVTWYFYNGKWLR